MKGRPEGSIIRDRLINILKTVGTSYGYELYNLYRELFGKVHMRTIYYNLKKGLEKEEIIVVSVAREIGNYSWGDEVEKVYYTVGPYAKTELPKKEQAKVKSLKLKRPKVKVDWKKEITNLVAELKKEMKTYQEKKKKLSNQNKKIITQRLKEKLNKIKMFSKGKITDKELKRLTKDIKIE
jgi:hypothetical protein